MKKQFDRVFIALAILGLIAMIPAIAHDLHLFGL